MTRWLQRILFVGLGWSAAFAAWSQGAHPVDLNAMLSGAAQVVQAIDRGQAAALWDNASPEARKQVDTAAFVKGLQARTPLGAPAMRQWVQMAPTVAGPDAAIPAGNYITVVFLSRFADGRQLHEIVTLRQDDDKSWRLAGYTAR